MQNNPWEIMLISLKNLASTKLPKQHASCIKSYFPHESLLASNYFKVQLEVSTFLSGIQLAEDL